jgi:hypothetical protein
MKRFIVLATALAAILLLSAPCPSHARFLRSADDDNVKQGSYTQSSSEPLIGDGGNICLGSSQLPSASCKVSVNNCTSGYKPTFSLGNLCTCTCEPITVPIPKRSLKMPPPSDAESSGKLLRDADGRCIFCTKECNTGGLCWQIKVGWLP